MTIWTGDELTKIGAAEELQIASLRGDGTLRNPVTVWVVRHGDDLYVRSVNGRTAIWFCGTQVRNEGRIWAGGVEKDVTFVDADHDIDDELDAAYRTKYRRYAASIIRHIVSSEARSAWIKQPHYNLIYREEEREMLPLCQDQKIAVIPYSPMAKGLLTRKLSKERNETPRAQTDAVGKRLYTEEDLQITQRVSDVVEARRLPMAQVALAWMLSKPVVTAPIIGATKPYHLDDAVAAVSVQLTLDEIRQVEEAYQPHPVLGYS